ncbi:MAG: DEAD/DEAH box helicase [Clostridia bacterium]|nr:DEAD/DEAH box helicase [Clostridia bacterium]
MDIFNSFAPVVRDFIYKNGWDELREVQVKAAEVLFGTENDLLLSSGTASGKTEAAFFPIISILSSEPQTSFGAIYISPLKSLINDQFARLDMLLDESGIPVYHWHGDVAASHKNKALKDPKGILQITPESFESMLMNRSNDMIRLFTGLKFVVLDEIHVLTGTDRGNQIICQLCRLQRLIGSSPRRIGLSATVSDLDTAAKWLSGGSGHEVSAPVCGNTHTRWKLGAEHFYIQNENIDQTSTQPQTNKSSLDAGYEYVYDCTKGKKCLVFSNSREETEYVTATLRQIAARRGERDRFIIHHGNLSSSIREEAEMRLKNDDNKDTACATVTLELGIDIGRLERIVQMGAPTTVSGFLQRIGRSGRRGEPPEMMMIFREENPLPNTPLPQLIPWELLRAIAIVQLYIEERFIEPPSVKKMPMSLLFQQTLSILTSSGALSVPRLAERILTLPPFANVEKEDYRELLIAMLQNDYLEMTEEKELIPGLAGEKLTSSFKFYAVFKDSEDFTVRCESDEIGTITTPPPVGDRFALAGRVWEVEELDISRRLVYVHKVDGKMEIAWPGDYGEIHTRILEKMRDVLNSDKQYPYLKPNAARRLDVARHLARNTGMTEHSVVHLGGYTWAFFPWLGTRSFRTIRKLIARNGSDLKISRIEYEGCYYITFKMENGNEKAFLEHMASVIGNNGIDKYSLVNVNEMPVFDKYDPFIPSELLRKAYAADRLRDDEIPHRINELLDKIR